MMMMTPSYGANKPAKMGQLMRAAMLQNGGMRGSRRANMRSVEKKMSPAMVNAMLNKMANNMKQMQDQEDKYSAPTSGMSSYGKPGSSAMALMMKSPAAAEMMANLMMAPQMSTAMAQMTPVKREQMKRMMMAAVMAQQQQQQEETQQQEDNNGSYGQQAPDSKGPMMMDEGQKSANDYSSQMPTTSTISPMMGMMNPSKMSYGQADGSKQMMMPAMNDMSTSGYGQKNKMTMPQAMMMMMMNMNAAKGSQSSANDYGMGQQQRPIMPMEPSQEQARSMGYGGEQQVAMSMAGKGMSGMNNNNGMNLGAYMSSMMKPQMQANSYQSPMMNNGANKNSMYGGEPTMMSNKQMMSGSGSGYGMDANKQEQQREMMGAKTDGGNYGGQMSEMTPMMPSAPAMGTKNGASGAPMNGFKQAYQQPSQQAEGETKGATKGGSDYKQTDMARPAMPQMSQQAYGQEEQQQQEDGYGAAPMGMAEPFAFDYKIDDGYGNGQYRKEESDKDGVVRGSYGYMDNMGLYRHVEYVADENGFRANIKSNEPGLSSEPAASKSASSEAGKTQVMESPMATMDNNQAGNQPQQQQQQQQMMDSSAQQQQQQQQSNENGEK